jgi:hypothetical protein
VALVIEHSLQVGAPAEQVWAVLNDLDRYPEWNPFVVSCTSTLAVGDPVSMRVRVFPWWAGRQRERILEHEPGHRLCYGLTGLPFEALASLRCHDVHALTPDSSRYVSRFELTGRLAPVVSLLLGRRLSVGFTSMSHAVKARAEALHEAR